MMRFISLLLLFGLLPVSSQAWWNKDWAYRKEISVQTPQQVRYDGELGLLVRLHSGNFNYFFDIKDGGADIRFMAGDDATPLKYQVEKLDPLNGMALIWVKLPAADKQLPRDKFYMYYGNQAAPAAADAAGTFDTATVLALHFLKDTPVDQTAYGNNPAAFDGTWNKASLIGAGAHFDGQSHLTVPATPSLALDSGKGFTISAWVKPDDSAAGATLFDYGDADHKLSLKLTATGPVAALNTAAMQVQAAASQPLATGWHFLAVVLASDALKLYVDGEAVASAAVTAPIAFSGALSVATPLSHEAPEAAGEATVSKVQGYSGELDELRIATVARGQAYLRLRTLDEGPSSALLGYGEDQDQQSGEQGDSEAESVSYFNVILQNVTVDGWVVIILLGIMGVIALLVMFFKWLYLGRISRATRRFMKAYARLDPDVDGLHKLLDQESKLKSSPLYTLYAVCLREVDKRVGGTVGAQASAIDAKGMVSIRAALDGVTVRQNQKINARMVLLTIAISGGPFLGLLGTVVGVMITFAAIAASGDVNINAIAPGIAAALVATVAGLAVAIPALFAYNYLGSQIKDVMAEMRVFTDELLARIGEAHGA